MWRLVVFHHDHHKCQTTLGTRTSMNTPIQQLTAKEPALLYLFWSTHFLPQSHIPQVPSYVERGFRRDVILLQMVIHEIYIWDFHNISYTAGFDWFESRNIVVYERGMREWEKRKEIIKQENILDSALWTISWKHGCILAKFYSGANEHLNDWSISFHSNKRM